jgi:hypothetical protein
VDAEAAETYLRVLAETQLRRFRAPGSTDWDGVRELRYAGAVLAALGVLPASLAESIANELDAVVNVRIRRSGTSPVLSVFAMPPAVPYVSPEPPPAPVAEDPPVLTPAGQLIPLDEGPGAPCLHLLSVARTPDRTEIAVAGRLGPRWTGTGFYHAVRTLAAMDDAGFSLTVQHSGGSSDGLLTLVPAPPAGARWVEIFRDPDGPRTRVDLTAAPTRTRVVIEPVDPASPAERLLDAIASDMLGQLPGTPHHHVGLDLMVAALEAAGLLPPGSPAAGRLAVLCQRAAFHGGRGLVAALADGRLAPAELPVPWASVLAYFRDGRHRTAGPPGTAPVAAVLPEIDGVRFAVSGLNTEAEHTGLRVQARGLTSGPVSDPPGILGLLPWFPWWARDSTGQWHVTTDHSHTIGNGRADVTLWMVPPVSPAATSLELIVTGQASRMRVTLPLDWRAEA